MKRTIAKRLIVVIVVSMMLMALISYYFQVKSAQEIATANSVLRIGQIKQILHNNNEEIEKLKNNLKEDYFIRAKAAAYIIQNNPEIITDLEELRKIATFLQVDEFHLFDKKGTLYAGTEPKYFNYTFYSGEQMQFFLPMLEDNTLQLCQDIVPNTAEQKLMQYAAVWSEDKTNIVQIGMEPVRLIEAMKKNELSHIFTMVTADKDNTLFAADGTTGEILGSNNTSMIGKNIEDFGVKSMLETDQNKIQIRDIIIDDLQNYCVMELTDNVIIGVSIPYQIIYQNIPANMALIVLSLIILAMAVVALIIKMLDYYIIKGMHRVNYDLDIIEAGDLDYRVDVTHLPEFRELSSNINQMVESLLENTAKLSLIFQNVNVPIAVYEYNQDMKRVLATNKIGGILDIPKNEMEEMLEDQTIFITKLKAICQDVYSQEEDVYRIGEQRARYVKIKSYEENNKTLGILVDITEEVLEKQQIQYERDIDLLTGLYTRRAFFSEIDRLFQRKEGLNISAMLMIDVDNLKQMNDNYGHEYGDKLLQNVATILKSCEAPHHLTARLSGDEFVMFLYEIDSEELIQHYVDLLYQTMKHTIMQLPDHSEKEVSFSCGYTILGRMDYDYQEALKIADQMMYQAKKNHKGDYVRYQAKKNDIT